MCDGDDRGGYGRSMKKRIDLHVTISMFEELKQIAEDRDITITTLLKLIIQEYLSNRRGK